MFPNFPALQDSLAFWQQELEGPPFAVTVEHSKLSKPADYAPWTVASGCINAREQSFRSLSLMRKLFNCFKEILRRSGGSIQGGHNPAFSAGLRRRNDRIP